jgi:hypothetical protein
MVDFPHEQIATAEAHDGRGVPRLGPRPSPSTGYRDNLHKLAGYFRVPSIQHYLIVDPIVRRIVHHKRGVGDALETRLIASGPVSLDPPGLEIAAEDVFAGL